VRRTSIYIIFSVSIILAFTFFVRTLDEEAVHDLEANFNNQQLIQVELASRSLEEQFGWHSRHVNDIATNLSVIIEYLHLYDSSGRRLLYSARSENQVSPEALATRLDSIVSQTAHNEYLIWGFFGQEQEIIVSPANTQTPHNASYGNLLKQWMNTYYADVNEGLWVTPIYATPDEQLVGLLYPVTNLDGEQQGVLGTILTLNPIIEQFIKPVRSGQFGAAWIQDFSGVVIFDHETEIIGQNVFDLHVNYPDLLDLNNLYPVQQTGIGEYSFTVERGGEVRRKLVAWDTATLGNQNLTVALSAPDTEISALLTSSRQTSLFLGIVLTALLAGSGWLFYYVQQNELRSLVAERTHKLEKEQARLTAEIADRKSVEEALRASETNFRQLAENIREVFFLIDTSQNQIVYVSPSYGDIWRSDIMLTHKTPFAIIPTVYPDDRTLVRDQIKLFMQSPEVVSTEFRIIRGDGVVRWIRWRAFPVVDSDTIKRVICTAEDITAQKKARDTEITIEIERERTQLLANFVQDAFHEFRTPLSIINTSVYLLSNVSDPDKRTEYLQFIRQESGNIMHLVEQLVTMARLDVDEPFRNDRIHVDTMMSDLQIMLEPDINTANLHSTWQLDTLTYYIEGDQEQLHRAIKNILHNAIKYSNAGDNIYVRTRMENQFVIIEVADTGEGIDPNQIDHIFERFYRVDKAHSTRGFGLGLPIAHRIIERHNGTITAQSEVGLGSTFRIHLPIAKIIETEQLSVKDLS